MEKLCVLAIVCLVLVFSGSVLATGVVPASLRLIPKPSIVEDLEDSFDFANAVWHIGKTTTKFPLEELYEELDLRLNESPLLPHNAYFGTIGDFQEVTEICHLTREVPDNPEAYYLEVTKDRIVIIGNTDQGAFYGIQTLRQLIDKNRAVGTIIKDYPEIRYRAITDDISRGPIPKLEFMKQIVKTMSEFKLNMYSPYMELQVLDGIRFKEQTLLASDYKELVEYAKDYHVEIVPSLQTFGHCNVFLGIPKYQHLGNLPIGSSQLDPTNPEVYEFLEEQISKWAKLTDSRFVSIGGDETWEIGTGNSGALAREIGEAQVYLDHTLKVMDIVKRNGKTPLFWGDMALLHPEIITEFPDDAVVLNWHYGDSTSMDQRLQAFKSAEKVQWACPGIDNWLRIFPFYQSSNNNVRDFARIGKRYGIEGLFTTTWDDDGDNLFGNNWYGVIFAAETAWTAGQSGTDSFNRRFDMAVFGEELDIVKAILTLASTNTHTYRGYFKSSNLLFFQNPFADLEFYQMINSHRSLLNAEQEVLRILQKAAPKRNQHIIETLGFAARRNGAFGRKIGLAKRIIDTVSMLEGKDVQMEFRELAQELYDYEIELRGLYDEFEMLYLNENKEYYLKELKQRYFGLRAHIYSAAMELETASYLKAGPSPGAIGLPASPLKGR